MLLVRALQLVLDEVSRHRVDVVVELDCEDARRPRPLPARRARRPLRVAARKNPRTAALFTRKDSIRRGPCDGREEAGPHSGEPAVKLLAAIAVALVFPASALAGDARLVTQEVPLGAGARTLASARPPLRPRRSQLARAGRRALSHALGRRPLDRVAARAARAVRRAGRGTPEGRSALQWRLGNPTGSGRRTRSSTDFAAASTRLRAHFVRSTVPSVPARTLSIAGSPAIVPRARWGADEEILRAGRAFAPALRLAVVHHTAGANGYTAAQAAAIVRGIEVYHVKGNGWNDIGYNFLVDRFGHGVRGSRRRRRAERDRRARRGVQHRHRRHRAARQLRERGADRMAQQTRSRSCSRGASTSRTSIRSRRSSYTSGGNAKFRAGKVGDAARGLGPPRHRAERVPGRTRLRAAACARAARSRRLGLPKLYAPAVSGSLGGLGPLQARLSSALPWTVHGRPTPRARRRDRHRRGRERRLDVGCHVRGADRRTRGRSSAGADVRPAVGTIGQVATSLTMTGAQAKPATFTPNGDGQADSTVISYTLSLASTVTATLRRRGRDTARDAVRRAEEGRRQSFRFTATGVAGRSVLGRAEREARRADVTANAVVPIVVDRRSRRSRSRRPSSRRTGTATRRSSTFSFVLAAARARQARSQGRSSCTKAISEPARRTLGWDGARCPTGSTQRCSRPPGLSALATCRPRGSPHRHEAARVPAALEGAAPLHRRTSRRP